MKKSKEIILSAKDLRKEYGEATGKVVALNDVNFDIYNGEIYVSFGYYCFVLFVIINAITLGTGSFSEVVVDVALFERIISMFHITKHAGLVEMLGQVLIACSLANMSLVMTDGKQTTTRKLKEINYTKTEIAVFAFGLIIMFLGALIESNTIINMS